MLLFGQRLLNYFNKDAEYVLFDRWFFSFFFGEVLREGEGDREKRQQVANCNMQRGWKHTLSVVKHDYNT